MPRFFVDSIGPEADFAILTGEQAAHAKVLRLKPGEAAVLCDGQGTDYQAEVTELDSSSITLRILSRGPSESEPKVDCTVYMGFAKGDKLEHVIQKATELGANRICAFPSSRCVAKFDRKSLEKKLPRWQKIAASAAEQSGRGRIPTVFAADSYAQALKLAAQADRALFFYENEQSHTLTAALTGDFSSVSIVTGPEGGFSTEEANQAADVGLQICTLGKRILRCETAPLCALSAIMYAAGEY